MCTFILAWRVFADAPVVVAANRDEAAGRPSTPPGIYETDPRVVAPRDESAGGTWLGYNEHGLLVAVTNRWVDADLPAERSRGLLVRDALRQRSATEARAHVARAVEHDGYDGFNVVVADADGAFLLAWDGDLTIHAFDPGLHVVVNVGADGDFDLPRRHREAAAEQARRTDRALADLEPRAAESRAAWLARAIDALSDHEYGFCVHGTVGQSPDDVEGTPEFGTRSASVVELFADGTARYRYADGPPCRTDLADVTPDA